MKLLQLLEFQNQNSKQAEILISSSPDKKKKEKKSKSACAVHYVSSFENLKLKRQEINHFKYVS